MARGLSIWLLVAVAAFTTVRAPLSASSYAAETELQLPPSGRNPGRRGYVSTAGLPRGEELPTLAHARTDAHIAAVRSVEAARSDKSSERQLITKGWRGEMGYVCIGTKL